MLPLKESHFFTEVYPEIKFISNGSLITLAEFREELWKVMQTSGYMEKLRGNAKFNTTYERLKKARRN